MESRRFFILFIATIFIELLRAQSFTELYSPGGPFILFPQYLMPFNNNLCFNATWDSGGAQLSVFNISQNEVGIITIDTFENPDPKYFTMVDNVLYFQATDEDNGAQLWALTDSVHMVSNIGPATVGSFPQNLTADGNRLYFAANDSVHGFELFYTDGMDSGVQLVSDILPGTSGSNPSWLTVYNGKLFFAANDSVHGNELWMSDGTPSGTQMVKDINTSPNIDSNSSSPAYLTVYNGMLYFAANDGTHGIELWQSDGTANGTQMLKDIWPGSVGSSPQNFTINNGLLFFQANDGVHGAELWSTDGTAANTMLISDINPGQAGSNPQNMISFNNKLYFQADDSIYGPELWVSNGTDSGTNVVKDIYPGTEGSYPALPIIYNSALYFVAIDSVMGSQLFVTNGTDTGTRLLAPDNAFPDALAATGPMTVFSNYLVFNANYDTTGNELWFYSDLPSAINGVAGNDQKITVFPNPFRSSFMVGGLDNDQTYTVSISDITGKLLQVQQISGTGLPVQIQTAIASAGVYLLEIAGNGACLSGKIVSVGR